MLDLAFHRGEHRLGSKTEAGRGRETIRWLFGAEQRALGYRAFFENARMLTVSVEANFIRDDTGSFTVDHFVEATYDTPDHGASGGPATKRSRY
jgi:hypothetical protein